MLSQLSNLLAGKRQSRALLQAIIVLTIILGYFFYSRDIYWYPGKDRVSNGGEAAKIEEEAKGSHAAEQSGEVMKISLGANPPAAATPTTMMTKTKPKPTSHKSRPRPPPVKLHPEPSLPTQTPNTTLLAQAPKYVKAILDPFDTSFDRLSCPASVDIWERYAHMRPASAESVSSKTSSKSLASLLHNSLGLSPVHEASPAVKPKYFFALDLYKIANLLPRLMNSIVEAIKFLGPENCVLSIVEGRSTDGTYEILLSLAPALQELGVRYILQTSDLDPKGGNRDRIDALAELRNLALADLINHPENYDDDTTIVFSNDVSLCPEDVLELVHQKGLQKADMVCGMDWNIWSPLTFYDSWVGRGINGDLFIKILRNGPSMVDTNLGIFWNHELSRKRHDAWKPVQVFACWNGITVFTAKPIMEQKIKFRWVPLNDEKECYQSEPNLFAKDMWFHGYGKIAVLPTVNLAYSDDQAKRLRAQKGWAGQHVADDDEKGSLIDWVTKPPEKVVCVPSLRGEQTWYSWNQGLPGSIEGEEGEKTEEEKKIEAEMREREKVWAEAEAQRLAEERKKQQEEEKKKQEEEEEKKKQEEKQGEEGKKSDEEKKEGEQKQDDNKTDGQKQEEEQRQEDNKQEGAGTGEARKENDEQKT